MYKHFPEFCLCQGHWKINCFLTSQYLYLFGVPKQEREVLTLVTVMRAKGYLILGLSRNVPKKLLICSQAII